MEGLKLEKFQGCNSNDWTIPSYNVVTSGTIRQDLEVSNQITILLNPKNS